MGLHKLGWDSLSCSSMGDPTWHRCGVFGLGFLYFFSSLCCLLFDGLLCFFFFFFFEGWDWDHGSGLMRGRHGVREGMLTWRGKRCRLCAVQDAVAPETGGCKGEEGKGREGKRGD